MRILVWVINIGLVAFLSGCAAPLLKFNDLKSAEELLISPGKEWEIHYKGQKLLDYLSTFREYSSADFVLVHNSQKGKMRINGYWYPVEYCEIKSADRPAIIIIKYSNDKLLRIGQVN